jgi:DNA-binding MarR family transcriptional regulator
MRDTSLEAYDQIQETIGKKQMEVLDTIRILGCPTNLELARYLHWDINQITPRVKELREKNYVTECEKRACGISGNSAMSWRLV